MERPVEPAGRARAQSGLGRVRGDEDHGQSVALAGRRREALGLEAVPTAHAERLVENARRRRWRWAGHAR